MAERTFMTSGLRIGKIRRIDVWIHWSLLLCFAYVLYLHWISASGWETLLRTAVWWAAAFGLLLIHELGHCYAAYRQGGGADAIVLWPLGGLAYCEAPRLAWNQFWVAAGGPLFQLIPTAAAGVLIWLLDYDLAIFPEAGAPILAVALNACFGWSLVILPFNLVPIYPLDGGRMFQAVLWARLRSYGRATLVSVWVSRITIGVVFLASLFLKDWGWGVLCILLFALFETERLNLRLRQGEEEDYVFGYDFSRGYTSLERTATRDRPRARPSLRERLRIRAQRRRELVESALRGQVDALLDKIAREGMSSLSRRERKFLERASKRLKN